MRESLKIENEAASILTAITVDLSVALDKIEEELSKFKIEYLEHVYINHNTKMIYVVFHNLLHQDFILINEILKSNLIPLGFKYDARKKFSIKYLKN